MSFLKKIQGQPSWTLATPEVEAALTRQGGHLAPVRFRIGKNCWVEPFEVAPWAEEKLAPETPDLLRVLRGDFFCLPFGANAEPYRGEQHPPHGETCNAAWTLESSRPNRLVCSMETSVRKGRVEKTIELIPGHSAVYLRHVISGMKGPMSLGHHPVLKLPGANAGRISVSPFTYGQVYPGAFENPAQGGYGILKPGATFTSLRRVPRVDGQFADLSVYPSREGYEDLAMVAADPTLPFAWTALVVAEAGYVWFSLKNPRILRSTVFWMSNGGRHYAPWNGRHRHAIGLEEVTADFDHGVAASARRNALNRAGVETCVQLDPKKPLAVPFVMAVAAIPSGFDIVKKIDAAADGKSVTLASQSGKKIRVKLNVSFVSGA
jgi:hypothetical protein